MDNEELEMVCLLELIEFEYRQYKKNPFYGKRCTKGFRDFIKDKKKNEELIKWIDKKEASSTED